MTHEPVKLEMQAQMNVCLCVKYPLFFVHWNWNGSINFSLKFSTLYLMKISSASSEMFHPCTQKQQQGEINNLMGPLQGCERSYKKKDFYIPRRINSE